MPALAGFAAAAMSSRPWLYLVALPFSIVGFRRAMPGVAAVQRDQERLILAGCTQSLLAALDTPRDPPRQTRRL
jgi:hypothetical protein